MTMHFTGPQTRVVADTDIQLPAAGVAIGAFDGVHAGHQHLIRTAIEDARAQRVSAVVWTFDPPPKVFFGRAEQISPLNEKLARIATMGPDVIVVASFSRTYCRRSAAEFQADLARINPMCIHVGADFRYGTKQSGDTQLLAQCFHVKVAKPVYCKDGQVVSSTRIRQLMHGGDLSRAAQLQACPGPAALLAGHLQVLDHE
jgi:riboflavin kinase/FMN adenylyltransferase